MICFILVYPQVKRALYFNCMRVIPTCMNGHTQDVIRLYLQTPRLTMCFSNEGNCVSMVMTCFHGDDPVAIVMTLLPL